MTPTQLADEWDEAVARFPGTLPDGVEWPGGTPSQYLVKDSVSEQGVNDNVIVFHWLCAWEREAIAGNVEAVDTIAQFSQFPIVATEFQGVSDWERAVLEPARLGNLEGVKAEYAINCGHFDSEFGGNK